MINELIILVNTPASSFKAIGWISLLLGIIPYAGSIRTVLILVQLEGEGDPTVYDKFGTLDRAVFSHFAVVTLKTWPESAQSAMRNSHFWASISSS